MHLARLILALPPVWILIVAPAIQAAVPADQILPATTKGYLSLTNTVQATANWQRTQLGQLVEDEAMKPFIEDFKRQLERKVSTVQKRIGLTIGDIDDFATGEAALAIVHPGQGQAAVALVVDFAGNEEKLSGLLKKLERNVTQQKGTRTVRNVGGVKVEVFRIPPAKADGLPQEIALFVRDKQLCSSSNVAVTLDLLAAFDGNRSNRLVDSKPYQEALRRCAKEANGLKPDVVWFVDPFGFAKAYRLLDTKREKKMLGKDLVKILEAQGFDAIQGVAGFVNFYVEGKYEMLHRTAVYAPPVPGAPAGERYRLAMRMLDLPMSGPLEPQLWIPRDIATYTSFHLNIPHAFDSSETLIDEYLGHKGAFFDALQGIRTDPYGPKVDIRSQLIAHLGGRITAITDYELPITPTSERFLFAIETREEQSLAATIEKLMEKDPYARRREIGERVVWEVVEDADMPLPQVEFDDEDELFGPLHEREEDGGEGTTPSFPKSVVCVSDGHLFFASDIDFLVQVFTGPANLQPLAYEADFALVKSALEKLAPGGRSVAAFSRTDEEYRPVYELLRQGKMPESETILGRLLNELLTEDEEVLRHQRFDGSQLPSFEMVRRYFGPAGLAMTTEDEGWFLSGAVLNKNTPVKVAANPEPLAPR